MTRQIKNIDELIDLVERRIELKQELAGLENDLRELAARFQPGLYQGISARGSRVVGVDDDGAIFQPQVFGELKPR